MTESRLWSMLDSAFHAANRQLLLLLVAYLAAIGSLVSYAVSSDGSGTPTRLEFAFLLLSLLVMYYLSVQWKE